MEVAPLGTRLRHSSSWSWDDAPECGRDKDTWLSFKRTACRSCFPGNRIQRKDNATEHESKPTRPFYSLQSSWHTATYGCMTLFEDILSLIMPTFSYSGWTIRTRRAGPTPIHHGGRRCVRRRDASALSGIWGGQPPGLLLLPT